MNSKPIWTFLPGLHGTSELFEEIRNILPIGVKSEFIELPTRGKQHYPHLKNWLTARLSSGVPRILIAESFSGPLALQYSKQKPNEVCGVILAASFCTSPIHSGLAMLPLRPIFMISPPHVVLRHLLIGKDADKEQLITLSKVIQTCPSSTLSNRVRAILQLQEDDIPKLPHTPMMLLQARYDNLISIATQQQLEARYSHASVKLLDSPHLILQRRPETCLNYIKEFVSGIHLKK